MSKTIVTAIAVVVLFWYIIVNVIPSDMLLFFIALALIILSASAMWSVYKDNSKE